MDYININNLHKEAEPRLIFEANLDISKGKINKSYEIKLPNTSYNNNQLNNLFNKYIGRKVSFPAKYIIESVTFIGILLITEINEYSALAIFVTGNGLIWNSMQQDKLQNIDLTHRNIVLNKSNVIFSEAGYPFVVFDLVDRGAFKGGLTSIDITDRYPALNVSQLLVELFNAYGFNVNIEDNTEYFNQLYLLFTGLEEVKNSEDWLQTSVFEAIASTPKSYLDNGSSIQTEFEINQKLEFPIEQSDVGNNYDNTTFEYTVPEAGTYTFIYDYYLSFSKDNTSIFSETSCSIVLYKNQDIIGVHYIDVSDLEGTESFIVKKGTYNSRPIEYQENDVISIYINYIGTISSDNYWSVEVAQYNDLSGTLNKFYVIPSRWTGSGSTIEISKILPAMTVSDFIKNIFSLLNVNVFYDENNNTVDLVIGNKQTGPIPLEIWGYIENPQDKVNTVLQFKSDKARPQPNKIIKILDAGENIENNFQFSRTLIAPCTRLLNSTSITIPVMWQSGDPLNPFQSKTPPEQRTSANMRILRKVNPKIGSYVLTYGGDLDNNTQNMSSVLQLVEPDIRGLHLYNASLERKIIQCYTKLDVFKLYSNWYFKNEVTLINKRNSLNLLNAKIVKAEQIEGSIYKITLYSTAQEEIDSSVVDWFSPIDDTNSLGQVNNSTSVEWIDPSTVFEPIIPFGEEDEFYSWDKTWRKISYNQLINLPTLVESFEDLSDTTSYTETDALKFIRVNASYNGLEYALPDLSSCQPLIEEGIPNQYFSWDKTWKEVQFGYLSDVTPYTSTDALKFIRVNAGYNGLEYASIEQYEHPTGFTNQPISALTGANVISQITINDNGHVTSITSRTLTSLDIGFEVNWGDISGTLANQSDLNEVLNSKELVINQGTTGQYYSWDKTWRQVNYSELIGTQPSTSKWSDETLSGVDYIAKLTSPVHVGKTPTYIHIKDALTLQQRFDTNDLTVNNDKAHSLRVYDFSGSEIFDIHYQTTTIFTLESRYINLLSEDASRLRLRLANGVGGQTYTYTFPASNGISGQTLITNGSGVLTWGSVGNSYTIANVGLGTGIYKEVVSNQFKFKTLISNDSSVTISTPDSDTINLAVPSVDLSGYVSIAGNENITGLKNFINNSGLKISDPDVNQPFILQAASNVASLSTSLIASTTTANRLIYLPNKNGIVALTSDLFWTAGTISGYPIIKRNSLVTVGADPIISDAAMGNASLIVRQRVNNSNGFIIENFAGVPIFYTYGNDTYVENGYFIANYVNTTALQIRGGTNYVTLKSRTTGSSAISLYLPNTVGTSGYALTSNGSGDLIWADVSGGTNTVFTATVDGLVPAPGGTPDGSTYLNDLGDWVAINATGIETTIQVESGTAYSGIIKLMQGSGIGITSNVSKEFTISHADTSGAVSANNSGVVYIQDLTFDTYGHVTAITSATIPTFTGSTVGLVPAVSSQLNKYLKDDGTWDIPQGTSHNAVTLSGTPNYITLSGQDIVRNFINLSTHVTGSLAIASIAGYPNSSGQYLSGIGWAPFPTITPDLSNYVTIAGNAETISSAKTFSNIVTITAGLQFTSSTGLSFINSISGSTYIVAPSTGNVIQYTLPSIQGTSNQVLTNNGTGTLSWTSVSGASTFLQLTDTPSTYSGSGLMGVRVKSDTSGLEFYTIEGGTSHNEVSLSRQDLYLTWGTGGQTGQILTVAPISVGHINATGTANSTTFLRGDGTWAIPSGGTSGASTFLELTDTPSTYVGSGGKGIRVKSDLTGLEFYTPGDAGGTVTSIVAGNGMTFTTITTSGSITMGTPSDITAISTSSVTINTHSHKFVAPVSSVLTSNSSGALVGVSYGISGYILKSTGTGVSWISNTTTFLTLTDTPSSYATYGGKGVRVNASATALEFYTIDSSSYSLNLAVNSDAGTGVASGSTLRFIGDGATTISKNGNEITISSTAPGAGIGEIPALPLDTSYLRKRNSDTSASWVEYVSGDQGVTEFIGLTDTPNTYVGNIGKGLRVNSGATGLEFYNYTAITETLSGNVVIASFASDSIGAVTTFTTRNLTPGDIGAALEEHNHDTLYYRESEINDFFSGYTLISGYNKNTWDNAVNWGDHAGLYVPLGRTLTINGITQDLTINRTWSVGTVKSVEVKGGIVISGSSIDVDLSIESVEGTAGTVGTIVTSDNKLGVALGTTNITAAKGDHTHALLHNQSHLMTSRFDHTATAYRLFYSNVDGFIDELAFGNNNQILISTGTALSFVNLSTLNTFDYDIRGLVQGPSSMQEGSTELRFLCADGSWSIPVSSGTGMANPMINIGDMIYRSATQSATYLSIGNEGEVLKVINVSGSLVPRWSVLSSTFNMNITGDIIAGTNQVSTIQPEAITDKNIANLTLNDSNLLLLYQDPILTRVSLDSIKKYVINFTEKGQLLVGTGSSPSIEILSPSANTGSMTKVLSQNLTTKTTSWIDYTFSSVTGLSYTGNANKFLKVNSAGDDIIFSSIATLSAGEGLIVNSYNGLTNATFNIDFNVVAGISHLHSWGELPSMTANRILGRIGTNGVIQQLSIGGALGFSGEYTLISKLELETTPKLIATLNANNNTINNTAHITPVESLLYDLGNYDKRYRDLYLTATAYVNSVRATTSVFIGNWRLETYGTSILFKYGEVTKAELTANGNMKFFAV